MSEKKFIEKVFSFSWKDWVFGISFLFMLVFTTIFGLQGKSTEMGFAILAGLFGMGFSHLDEIVEISGLGIKLRTRKLDKKIIELEELEGRLKKQEEELNNLSDYMIHALITAFRDIGALHIENQKYVFAADIAMMAIQLYAYNPKDCDKKTVDAILSGMIGLLSEGTPSKGPIADLLKSKKSLVLSDYDKMKENKADCEIIKKYEKVMSKAGIEFKKD